MCCCSSADHRATNLASRPGAGRLGFACDFAICGFAAELLLLDDHRLDGRHHAVLDLDDDHVRADVADRLLEVDLALVDLDPARVADRVGDVLGGDRAEQASVVAGLLGDRQDGLAEQAAFSCARAFDSRSARSAAALRSWAASSAPFVAGWASLRGIR